VSGLRAGNKKILIKGLNTINIYYITTWRYHHETPHFVQLICINKNNFKRKPASVLQPSAVITIVNFLRSTETHKYGRHKLRGEIKFDVEAGLEWSTGTIKQEC
jgi:hypothetical protein